MGSANENENVGEQTSSGDAAEAEEGELDWGSIDCELIEAQALRQSMGNGGAQS